MFDDFIRELEKLERQRIEVRIPVEADEDGYLDKECPSDLCLFQFKVHEEDWTNLVSDDGVFCPMCRHSAPADSWWTREQLKGAERQVIEQLEAHLDEALRRGAKEFNRRQRSSGFVRMSLEVRGTRARRAIVPLASTEPLDLRITCEACTARYAVVGSAFFCPACGHSSATRVFDDSVRKVRLKAEASESLPAHYARLGSKNEGEILARSLLETALSDCVVAFQRLCEQLYAAHAGTPVAPNVFQRLEAGSQRWRELLGEGYEDWLPANQLEELQVLFNRRHLLQHTEGIVDEKYLARSGDTTYQIGQRIVVRRADVARMADLITELANALRRRLD